MESVLTKYFQRELATIHWLLIYPNFSTNFIQTVAHALKFAPEFAPELLNAAWIKYVGIIGQAHIMTSLWENI